MTGAQYRLVVRQGPNTGQIIELDKSEIFIGRDIANDIVFNDAEVSRKHAQLTLEGDRYKIEDLNSTNGTYINGQRLIGPHVLAIGEIIMFGDNVGVIFDGEPAATDVTVPSTIDLGITPVSAIPAPIDNHIQPALPRIPQSSIPITDNISIPQQSPMEDQPEQPAEANKKPINSWLLAGCGCVLVIIVLIVALWVFIDQPWNPGGGLYCVSPFDILFKSIGYCP
jgi:pSer/pThr/pTyr-binding forkhead associated (FHA) protein